MQCCVPLCRPKGCTSKTQRNILKLFVYFNKLYWIKLWIKAKKETHVLNTTNKGTYLSVERNQIWWLIDLMHMAVLTKEVYIIQTVIRYTLWDYFLFKKQTSYLYAVIYTPRNICYVRRALINAEKQPRHMYKLMTGFIGMYRLYPYNNFLQIWDISWHIAIDMMQYYLEHCIEKATARPHTQTRQSKVTYLDNTFSRLVLFF